MAQHSEFQEQVQRLGQLLAEFDQQPESASKVAGKALVQLLMDLHGAALERMLECVFESGDPGQRIIDKLGQDPLAGSLLLLYSLHPDDIETRVQRAADRLRPRLRKLACSIGSVAVRDGAVQVHLSTTGHSCGSSAADLRQIVEDAIYELAPDLASLEILGLDPPAPAGFIPLEKLFGGHLSTIASTPRALESEAAD